MIVLVLALVVVIAALAPVFGADSRCSTDERGQRYPEPLVSVRPLRHDKSPLQRPLRPPHPPVGGVLTVRGAGRVQPTGVTGRR